MANNFNVIDLGQIYRNADAGRASAQNAQMQQMQIEQAMDQRRKQNAMNQIFSRNYQPEQQIPAEQLPGPTQSGEPLIGRPAQTIPGGMNMSGAMQEMYGSGLAPEAWKMQMDQDAMNARNFGSKPSAIQVFEYFKNLPNNTDRETMLRTMRGAQYGDVGGVRSEMPALPGGQIRPLTSLENEAAGQGAIAGRKSREQAFGTETGKEYANYQDMNASFPRLEEVAKQLSDLGKSATYTQTGQALDATRREIGMAPRQSAIARKEYISKVDNEVLPLLRETFGAAFTAKEGESLKLTLGDPNATPQEKDAVLRSFIDSKRANIQTKSRRFNEQSVPSVPARSGGQIKKIGNDTYVNINGQWYKQ